MPRVSELVLRKTGSRRRLELTTSGTVLFDRDGDSARNGVLLRVTLHAQDRPLAGIESVGNTLCLCDVWLVRGQNRIYEPSPTWDGNGSGSENWLGGTASFVSANRHDFEFSWDNRRTRDGGWLDRIFNEDRPGKDEIVASARVLPVIPGGSASDDFPIRSVVSEMIRGRF